MKINNITAYQNPRPNFKGAYVLSGSAEDVRKAESLIMEKCGHYINFHDYDYVNLQPIFSKNQQNVKYLITTNKHCKNAESWRKIYESDKSKRTELSVLERVVTCVKKMNPYFYAQEEMDRNNNAPMEKMLNNLAKKAERTLKQVKKCAVEPMGDVKVLDAKEVIKAIRNKRFNFITGVIGK